MAILVPTKEQIKFLPVPLMPGERALMDALMNTLNDEWTVYVQPHLNGLRPDIIAYSEKYGLGIFEVKDWDLDYYRIKVSKQEIQGENSKTDVSPEKPPAQKFQKKVQWERFDSTNNTWKKSDFECPFTQVKKYRNSIFNYEIPILGAASAIDKMVFSYVQMYVFFYNHETNLLNSKLEEALKLNKYVNVFGGDLLQANQLNSYLLQTHLTRFFDQNLFIYLQQENVDLKIRNALDYKVTKPDIQRLQVKFNKKQKDLLPNTPGKRRVLGGAGSGKTLILVHKAVEAAKQKKQVLLVCFNITMSNYLRDMATCLANDQDINYHRYIEVRHYHRMFPPEWTKNLDGLPSSIDVLLIDEGQDFEREWIQNLIDTFNPVHLMFVEDTRQNIYQRDERKRRNIPGIIGAPNRLSESFRLPSYIAKVANALIEWLKFSNDEIGHIEITDTQMSIFGPYWVNCPIELALNSLKEDINLRLLQGERDFLENTIILVCTIEDGWKVLDVLEEMNLPYQVNFETRAQNKAALYNADVNKLSPQEQVEKLRRGLKAHFFMSSGKIKVCTIHSFKGWELENVIILFRPSEELSREVKTLLLYTAITRSTDKLSIYNIDSELNSFGDLAIETRLLQVKELSNHPESTMMAINEKKSQDRIPNA